MQALQIHAKDASSITQFPLPKATSLMFTAFALHLYVGVAQRPYWFPLGKRQPVRKIWQKFTFSKSDCDGIITFSVCCLLLSHLFTYSVRMYQEYWRQPTQSAYLLQHYDSGALYSKHSPKPPANAFTVEEMDLSYFELM